MNNTKATRRNLVREVMEQLVNYGGCAATRKAVYDDCVSRGLPHLAADRFAFMPEEISVERAASMPTLAHIRSLGF